MTIDKRTLDLAREWVGIVAQPTAFASEETKAAAEVIAALPGTVVDGEKIREVIHKATWQGVVMEHMRKQIVDDLEALLPAPTPRTLDDMTEEERAECQWMQATVMDEEDVMTGVIQMVHPHGIWVMFKSGRRNDYRPEEVVPRPDLPRMVWPDSEPEADDTREPERPSPEDVLDGEVWAVSDAYADGIGYRRSDQPSIPWFVSYPDLDGVRNWHVWADDEVTLLHRLVPEQPRPTRKAARTIVAQHKEI